MIKILQNVSIGPLSNLPSRTRRTNRIGPYKVHEDKSFCFSFMCISSKVDLRQADPTVHLLQRVRIGQLFRESLWLHFLAQIDQIVEHFLKNLSKNFNFYSENCLGDFLGDNFLQFGQLLTQTYWSHWSPTTKVLHAWSLLKVPCSSVSSSRFSTTLIRLLER